MWCHFVNSFFFVILCLNVPKFKQFSNIFMPIFVLMLFLNHPLRKNSPNCLFFYLKILYNRKNPSLIFTFFSIPEEITSSSMSFLRIDSSSASLSTWDFSSVLLSSLKYLFSSSNNLFSLSQSKIIAFKVVSVYFYLRNSV